MSNKQTLNCFICDKKVFAYRHAMQSITEFECSNCGRYYLSDFIKGENSWIRPVMFHYLNHSTNLKNIFFILEEPENKDEYENFQFVTKEALSNMRPKTLNEKIDMILLNLGKSIKFWGDGVSFGFSGLAEAVKLHRILSALLLMCDNITDSSNDYRNVSTEIHGTLKFLEDYGYLERKGSTHEYSFTVDGWKHLGELRLSKHELPQAFIAMRFSPEMDAARESIKNAITDNGYIPVVIDEKEHNKQIVPEIFYEIQRSKFLIADLTGHRNGVYYEAGYAQGLGKEVILTCNEDDFKERHFDVAQISTIVWSNTDDLYARLLKRIEATVGKRTAM